MWLFLVVSIIKCPQNYQALKMRYNRCKVLNTTSCCNIYNNCNIIYIYINLYLLFQVCGSPSDSTSLVFQSKAVYSTGPRPCGVMYRMVDLCNYLPPTPDHVPLHQAADGAPISTSWSHYSNLQCTDDPSQHTRTAITSPVHGETVDQQPTPSSAVMVRVPAADPYK